jgi:hypothetical protein
MAIGPRQWKVPTRLTRIVAVLAVAASAAVGSVVAASPASADATVCSAPTPAGYGRLDTVKVCTRVELHDTVGWISYFTTNARPGPREVDLRASLYLNDTLVATNFGSCAPVPPGSKCEVSVNTGQDTVPGQKWYTVGDWTANHVGQITSGSVRSPNNWRI